MISNTNLNSTKITIDMVENFQIHEDFRSRYPCSHGCKITLKDGRKVKKGIIGPQIYVLIQAIAKEKITFERDQDHLSWGPQNIDHFSKYEDYWKYLSPKSLPPLPEEILSAAFQLAP